MSRSRGVAALSCDERAGRGSAGPRLAAAAPAEEALRHAKRSGVGKLTTRCRGHAGLCDCWSLCDSQAQGSIIVEEKERRCGIGGDWNFRYAGGGLWRELIRSWLEGFVVEAVVVLL